MKKKIKIDYINLKDISSIFALVFNNYDKSNHLIVAKALIDILEKRTFKGWKLIDDDKIVGYIIGYGITSDVFYFADIGLKSKYRYKLKEFIDFVENDISKTYKSWLSNSVTPEGDKLLNKIAQKVE